MAVYKYEEIREQSNSIVFEEEDIIIDSRGIEHVALKDYNVPYSCKPCSLNTIGCFKVDCFANDLYFKLKD